MLGLFAAAPAQASVLTAASCGYDDVASKVSDAVTGDIVVIPPGDCTGDKAWAKTLYIPSTKKITLQGSGIGSTIIAEAGRTIISLGSAGGDVEGIRVTNIRFNRTATSYTATIVAAGQNWRVDNCYFDNQTGLSQMSIAVNANGSVVSYGLVDNNDFIDGRVVVSNSGAGFASGSAIWTENSRLGTGGMTVIEDNYFYKGWVSNVIDCNRGASYMARYNTVEGQTEFMVHGYQDEDERGSRNWEIYGNTFAATTGGAFSAIWNRSGTGVIFGNTFNNYTNDIVFDERRNGTGAACVGCDFNEVGWCNGSSTADGNVLSNGWPCRDQIGRGKDDELWLSKTTSPSPTQEAQPVYIWNNRRGETISAVYIHSGAGAWIVANRDYFNEASTFDGTAGVGCGTELPATCVYDDTYGVGVGFYVAGDGETCGTIDDYVGTSHTKSFSGKLYRCTADDTWTEYYTPYTYPHPLRGEGDPDIVVPTVLSVIVNGANLLITFSESITATSGAAFTLDPSGADVTVSCPAVATAAVSMTCTISRALTAAETATYAYTGTKVIDAAENHLAEITATAITQNLTPAEAPTKKLTISKTGSGCTITSSPSGISCGSTCEFDFTTATQVTLGGYLENGWASITYGGDCASNGTVTVNADKTCTVTCTPVYLFN